MLILTRKTNQKLIINDNIEIVILESYKNSVKIGVNAPSDVQIYREEIYNEIKKSNKQAQLPQKHRLKNIKNTDFNGQCYAAFTLSDCSKQIPKSGVRHIHVAGEISDFATCGM